MEEMIFYNNAKENVTNFFEKEFPSFPALVMSHFLNQFNDLLNYSEEGQKIKPKIVFTDNIESIAKSIPKTFILPIFEDVDAANFNSRLKSILAIAKHDWCIYIDIKENKVSYGICMSLNSIKEKNFLQLLKENTSIKDKPQKVSCIVAHALNYYTMQLHSISGNELFVNFALDKTKCNTASTEIKHFVDATFSKLRTTQRKLADIKTMYLNIFTNVMSDVNGAICVIVDKDYKDNGLFEDGIWLKNPIEFSKLFSQSKSYSEEKLQAFAELFINMLNFDGITVIDNLGRIRAYNVFVENNSKRVGYIVGGARKRAAFTILSSKKKDVVGVYFQSHEGEVFFQEVKKPEPKMQKKLIKPTIIIKKAESEKTIQINTTLSIEDSKKSEENK